MGLDSYLTKRTYIGAEYKHRNVEANVEITINGKPSNIDNSKISEISERIGYWRKANAIHNWFVQNVQDGVDECQLAEVSREQLKTLRDECEKVLNCSEDDHETLPTTEGFFFGGTDYDEYYYEDIRYTMELIDEQLAEEENYEVTFYYQSSW